MSNKIYIVTGATGFVGNVLVKELVVQGKTVHAFCRSKEKAERVLGNLDIKIFYGDITDRESIEQCFTDHSAEYIVMHTAAVVLIHGTKQQYCDMQRINIEGAKNIVEVCLKHNAKLVHVSSVHAIPEPKKKAMTHEVKEFNADWVVGKYAKSKATSTQIVVDAIKEKGLNAVIVHPSGITGPYDYGDSHLTQMVADYMNKKIPAATAGGYDFVDVRDVVDGIIKAENAESGNCYILSNKYYTIRQLLDYLYEITNGKKIKTTLPIWTARLGAPFIGCVAKIKKERPLYTSYSLYTLQSNGNFSHEKATKELGYNPRELKESLTDTVEFILKMHNAE